MTVRSRRTEPSEHSASTRPQPAGSTRSSGLESGAVRMLLGLQRTVGNAGVVKLMARRGDADSRPAPGPRSPTKVGPEPVVQRAGPLVVTAVTTPGIELGVGRRMTARATVTGTGSTGLTWALSGAPTGVSIHPRGRSAEIRSAPSVPGAPIGGSSFTVTCGVGSAAPISSSPVLLVEVTGAAFTPVPAFGGPFVTAIGTAIAPLNTADPNRNGVSGNSATVNPVTAPAGRTVTVATRGAPGAGVSGLSVQPGSGTGKQKLRLTDTPTGTFLDTVIVINSVPTRVSGFGAQTTGMPAFYGGWNTVQFGASDPSGAANRPIAEIITVVRDDFGFGSPMGGAGAPSLAFSAPANNWTDQNGTPTTIDVNQFEGPGAIGLPRLILYRQQFFWMSWTGTFATAALATGTHRRTLRRSGTGHGFRTEQIFPGAAAPPMNDAYAGPPLIRLTGIAAVPAAPGATALAADGVSTGNLTVTSSVAGRSVNWAVVSGGSSAAITAGAAASAVGSPVVVTATTKPGLVRVRAADTVFANRRGEGTFRVAAVSLGRMTASPSLVPTGVLTATVTVPGRPGGRTVNFAIDSAALGAGVLASAPAVSGIDHSVVLTRPASFIGVVTVTATDSLIPVRTAKLKVRFK